MARVYEWWRMVRGGGDAYCFFGDAIVWLLLKNVCCVAASALARAKPERERPLNIPVAATNFHLQRQVTTPCADRHGLGAARGDERECDADAVERGE